MGNIVTLNTSVSVDTDETCTLSAVNLGTLISNAGNAYFGDTANWSLVQIEYRSSTGKQREIVTINPTVGTGIFKVSAKARQEQWTLHEIRVKDFDGDFYTVKAADMQGTDFDEPIIGAGGGGGGSYFEADLTVSPLTIQGFNASGWDSVDSLDFDHSFYDGMNNVFDQPLSQVIGFDCENTDTGMGENNADYIATNDTPTPGSDPAPFDFNTHTLRIELDVANVDLDGANSVDIEVFVNSAVANGEFYPVADQTFNALGSITADGTVTMEISKADLSNWTGSSYRLGHLYLSMSVNGTTSGTLPGANYDITGFRLIAVSV